jgi:hypothetical protein
VVLPTTQTSVGGAAAVRAYLEEVWGDAVTRFRLVADNTDAT